MKLLLDTHVFLWWLADDERLSKRARKSIAWLRGELKTPPMSRAARIEAGGLLRRVQVGEKLTMPE